MPWLASLHLAALFGLAAYGAHQLWLLVLGRLDRGAPLSRKGRIRRGFCPARDS